MLLRRCEAEYFQEVDLSANELTTEVPFVPYKDLVHSGCFYFSDWTHIEVLQSCRTLASLATHRNIANTAYLLSQKLRTGFLHR